MVKINRLHRDTLNNPSSEIRRIQLPLNCCLTWSMRLQATQEGFSDVFRMFSCYINWQLENKRKWIHLKVWILNVDTGGGDNATPIIGNTTVRVAISPGVIIQPSHRWSIQLNQSMSPARAQIVALMLSAEMGEAAEWKVWVAYLHPNIILLYNVGRLCGDEKSTGGRSDEETGCDESTCHRRATNSDMLN